MFHSLRPSFLLLIAPLAASLLVCLPTAEAGTYTWATKDANGNITGQSPTFTGGTVTVVTALHPISKQPPPPPAFSTSNGHYTGGGGCVTSSVMPGGGPGSVKVNSPANPIVATFTWQPAQNMTITTDPPPPAVLVKQDCTAQWLADTITNTATVSGTADCNLPGATVTNTTDSNGTVIGVSSSGTQYSVVQSPGANFSVPAQSGGQYMPTASFTPTAGTGAANGGASIDYQIQAFPIVIAAPNPLGRPDLGDGTNQFVYDATTPDGLLNFPGSIQVVGAKAPDTAWIMRGTPAAAHVAFALDLPAESKDQGWSYWD